MLKDILVLKEKSLLCKWSCNFATKVRKSDGTLYLPKSIHHYLLGIWRHIHTETKQQINTMSDTVVGTKVKKTKGVHRGVPQKGMSMGNVFACFCGAGVYPVDRRVVLSQLDSAGSLHHPDLL